MRLTSGVAPESPEAPPSSSEHPAAGESVAAMLDALEDLSDGEIDRLLAEQLGTGTER